MARQRGPRKNYYRLISDPREIRKRVGFYTRNPRPLCNQCLKRVHKVTLDLGKKIAERLNVSRFKQLGFWCDPCSHFYYLVKARQECDHLSSDGRRVTIDRGAKISAETGLPRFDQIGSWCMECGFFHQLRTRHVVVQLKDKTGY